MAAKKGERIPIILTDNTVRIDPDAWPVEAWAERPGPALSRIDRVFVRVRKDREKAIVYGSFEVEAFDVEKAAGYVVDDVSKIEDYVRRVGKELDLNSRCINDCLRKLGKDLD